MMEDKTMIPNVTSPKPEAMLGTSLEAVIAEQTSLSTTIVSYQPRSRAMFERVPLEVLHRIFRCIDTFVDRVSLNVTSRHFYSQLGTANVRKLLKPENRNQKLEFLFRLWQELPAHELCTGCAIYHNKHCLKDPEPIRLTPTQSLSWTMTDFIMSGESEKEKNAKALELSDNRHESKPEILDPNEWTPFVTCSIGEEGRLLVLLTWSIPLTVSRLQNKQLPKLPTCIHQEESQTLRDVCSDLIDVAPRPWIYHYDPDYVHSQQSRTFMCPWCPSEYRMMMTSVLDEKCAARWDARHALQIFHAMDFGPCYTWHSKEWRSLTHKKPKDVVATYPFEFPVTDDDDGDEMASIICRIHDIHGTLLSPLPISIMDSLESPWDGVEDHDESTVIALLG